MSEAYAGREVPECPPHDGHLEEHRSPASVRNRARTRGGEGPARGLTPA
jgi:hypothetical protein